MGHTVASQRGFRATCPLLVLCISDDRLITYDQLSATPPLAKTALISTVCSNKRQSNTLHKRRFDFTQELKSALPELEVFGRGVRPIEDKSVALDEYRYHVTIENHVFEHHWTEKLADAFLGYCLPFYCGAPNAADYFPPESFISINIHDSSRAIAIIQQAIRDDEYTKRLPHIVEARRRVLEEHNIFAVINKEIQRPVQPQRVVIQDGELRSRHAMRRNDPASTIRYLFERILVRTTHRWRAA